MPELVEDKMTRFYGSRSTATAHLPDRVGMFASLSCANVHRSIAILDNVVYSHIAVIETDCHQVRIIRIDIERHHSTV